MERGKSWGKEKKTIVAVLCCSIPPTGISDSLG